MHLCILVEGIRETRWLTGVLVTILRGLGLLSVLRVGLVIVAVVLLAIVLRMLVGLLVPIVSLLGVVLIVLVSVVGLLLVAVRPLVRTIGLHRLVVSWSLVSIVVGEPTLVISVVSPSISVVSAVTVVSSVILVRPVLVIGPLSADEVHVVALVVAIDRVVVFVASVELPIAILIPAEIVNWVH